ncbi:MAG TPA: 23S rRNA (adenine(1618)-N(6))-methyltransferase RlmF [Pseudomonas xinjiangensis]|uniref:Ribosomal RNA large subunit methyltransferase F n=2 Tax=root TaxID=1 RepID=A0A7V1BMV1_9GAMM|nr:23S rRNA (adenine(1618)-N(6))-methyltransferase RlmF [Halopseudomonas xinjiangensis]HEC46628.1 23S rRNA (adenine(1618)-N(6))-methyltransferase RlmF [Halopseudomonas xinjiangensis]
MSSKPHQTKKPAAGLHPRNRHQGRYDFKTLGATSPELLAYLVPGQEGNTTLDFTDPNAVKALNRALLLHHYGIRDWDIPAGYLCPPVPGRADYVHALADLLGESHDGHIPKGRNLVGLDIGTGANAIYPLIGSKEYKWRFVGTDIDPKALSNAQAIIDANSGLADHISLRLQADPANLFHGIIAADEHFDFTLCNPPFYASAAAAQEQSRRKWRNLEKTTGKAVTPHQSFGGQGTELYCDGGEAGFLSRLITESAGAAAQVFWFSSLVSKAANIKAMEEQLKVLGATDIRVIGMTQGLKHSRLLAWTFRDKKQRRAWRKARWSTTRPVA